jgi:hypothetical protein
MTKIKNDPKKYKKIGMVQTENRAEYLAKRASLSAPPAPARDEEIERLQARLEMLERSARLALDVHAERDFLSQEARRHASHYPEASDGRNTFILFAEMIERRSALQSERAGSGDAVRVALEAAATAVDKEWRASGAMNCTHVCAIIRSALTVDSDLPLAFADRHNDETGECEAVEVNPPMVQKLLDRIADRPAAGKEGELIRDLVKAEAPVSSPSGIDEPEKMWCESCGEAEQSIHTEYTGLCDQCWIEQGDQE